MAQSCHWIQSWHKRIKNIIWELVWNYPWCTQVVVSLDLEALSSLLERRMIVKVSVTSVTKEFPHQQK